MKSKSDVAEIKAKAVNAFKNQDSEEFGLYIDELNSRVEELYTYQAELLAKNEELSEIRNELDISREKYRFLYDIAPAAYLSMSKDGIILSSNTTTASLLKIQIKELIGKSFSDFILPHYQDVFHFHINSFSKDNECKSLIIAVKDLLGNQVLLSGVSKSIINGSDIIEIHCSLIDVTELEKSKSVIKEQEQLFSDIFEKAGDAIFMVKNDKYVDCNIKALEVFGLDSKDELIGYAPYDFSPELQPCGKKSNVKALEEIEKGYKQGVNHFEWQHFNKKIGLIYTDVTLTAIKKAGDDIIIVFLRDITAKKLAELEYKKSQANLFAAIDYSSIGIGIFSKEGFLENFNELFVNTLKIITGFELYPGINVRTMLSKQTDPDYWLEKLNIVISGESMKFERMIEADGKEMFLDFTVNPIFVGKQQTGFCVFINDISNFRASEIILKSHNDDLEERVKERTAELQSQTEFLTILIDSIPDLIFLKGNNGAYLNCNNAYCEYTGKPKEEIIGKTDLELYSEEDATKFVSFDKELFNSGNTVRNEQLLTFPDGDSFIFDTIKTPYYNINGDIVGLLGISRDVTEFKKMEEDIKKINQELEAIIEKRTLNLQQEIHERVRAEEALKKSREMYRNLFNDVPVGIYRTTLDGRIILANPALVTMLGFSTLNELKERNLNLEGFVDVNYREVFVSTLLSNDGVQVFDTIWLKKDGTELFVLEKAKAIKDYTNNVIYIEGTAEDITDRKTAERMQQTVYGISEAAYRFDKLDELYRFIHKCVNQLIPSKNFYISIFDEDSNEISFPYIVDEIETESQTKLGPYPFGDGLTEYVIKSNTFQLLDTRKIQELEANKLLNSSGPMPRSWLGVPLRTTANKTIGVIAVQSYDDKIKYDINAKDILVFVSTQIATVIYRKQIEEALYAEKKYLAERVLERTEELSALNAELESAVRTKDEFLANMSHELRTPLNAILGLSEIMLKHNEINENDKHKRALTTIRESGSHLLNLINDILDLSKIEAGRMDINFEELSVDNIANSCINLVKQAAYKKSIELSIEISKSCPNKFYADSVRIKQILINLLNNAVKFTGTEGKVGITISTNEAQNIIFFEIWDTGIGISSDNLSKLFKPFTQLSSNLSRDFEGTGLGLSLVSKLTEMHGGSVSVESEVGIGSRFKIALPVKSPLINLREIEDFSQKTVENINRALIIEDSADDAVVLSNSLARLQIKSELYQFDLDLFDVLNTNKYDVVFLDILLWDRSGWDLLSSIKKHPKLRHIPVIVNTVLKDRARATAYGANGYLNKPYSFALLYDILRKIDLKIGINQQNKLLGEGLNKVMDDKTIILLAEDNEANLQTLESFLDYAGFTVIVARNGREAVDAAVEYVPDLILMDIQMPKMDGLEAIRIIKQNNKLDEIPIIALTALAMPGDKERCIAAGADHYISKPVNFDTLIEAMNTSLPSDKRKSGK